MSRCFNNIYLRAKLYVRVHVYICVYIYIYTHTYIDTSNCCFRAGVWGDPARPPMHAGPCRSIYTHICIYIYIYAHMYREREREIIICVYIYIKHIYIKLIYSIHIYIYRYTCHILPPSEIDSGLCLAVFAGSGGKCLFHRIGRKGRIWQL